MFAWDVVRVCLAALLIAELNNVYQLFPHFVTEKEKMLYWGIIALLFVVS